MSPAQPCMCGGVLISGSGRVYPSAGTGVCRGRSREKPEPEPEAEQEAEPVAEAEARDRIGLVSAWRLAL